MPKNDCFLPLFTPFLSEKDRFLRMLKSWMQQFGTPEHHIGTLATMSLRGTKQSRCYTEEIEYVT